MAVVQDAIEDVLKELRIRSKKEEYKVNPVLWAEEVLGVTLWSKQKEMLMSVVHNKRTAVKSCHSSGKSYTMGIAACWWVSTRDYPSLVVSTAPTYAQVHQILWAEIKKHYVRAGLVGEILESDRWTMVVRDPLTGNKIVEEVAIGKRPADENDQGFQGLHRENGVLFLIDEAVGCPQMIFTSADVNTTAEHDRILAIANPDNPHTAYGRIWADKAVDEITGKPLWNYITISAFDTPNFTGEEIPDNLRGNLPQPSWVSAMKSQWGENSPRYQSKVLAEFPTESDSQFITQNDIYTALETEIEEDYSLPLVLGVDVAGKGNNNSVIYANRGGVARFVDKWNGKNIVETCQRIHKWAVELGADEVRIDGSGMGAQHIELMLSPEFLRTLPDNMIKTQNYTVIGIYGGAASPDLNRWANARAHFYDTLRMAMRTGKIDLEDEKEKVGLTKGGENKLFDEMLSIQEVPQDSPKADRRSAIKLEDKKDMKKRGFDSPDLLDALVYACADLSKLLNGPLSEYEPGEIVPIDIVESLSWFALGW